MAKRWRNMSEAERTEWLTGYTSAVGRELTAMHEDGAVWDAFIVFARSAGDVLTPLNTLSAFGQYRALGVAKVSDLRTWSDWIAAGRTPRAKRKVSVFTTFPLHLWDVADTDVTDRKAWRKAPPVGPVGDGNAALYAAAEMVWQSFGVVVGIPEATPEQVREAIESDAPAPVEPVVTPGQREAARLRAEGYKGTLDQMMRAEWHAETERLHDIAEEATRGEMRNKRGEAKGVSTRELMRNSKLAGAYASEELTSWFATNGGVPTFATYRARLMGERAPRQTFADTVGA
jgi:hypothetical protein